MRDNAALKRRANSLNFDFQQLLLTNTQSRPLQALVRRAVVATHRLASGTFVTIFRYLSGQVGYRFESWIRINGNNIFERCFKGRTLV